ncbi:TolB family protein [Acidobacteriota bacterium]
MKYKTVYTGIILSIIFTLNIHALQDESPVLKGPYLGQKLPGVIPEIFAPGIVSTEVNRELGGCSFSPDGKECYFTRAIDDDWVIMVTRLESEGWTIPEPVEFSKGFTALYPHVTLDNHRVLWQWRGLNERDEGMYTSRRTLDGWSEAEYVGSGMNVSSTRDGEMYVTDNIETPNRVTEVKFEKGRFTQYIRLEGEIEYYQKEFRSAHPCISPDGSYIIFDDRGTFGSLYVSFRNKENDWGKPIALTEHGFHPESGIATISPDGKYLFFGIKGDTYWVSTKIIEDLKPDELRWNRDSDSLLGISHYR